MADCMFTASGLSPHRLQGTGIPDPGRAAVRVNGIRTPFFEDDMKSIVIFLPRNAQWSTYGHALRCRFQTCKILCFPRFTRPDLHHASNQIYCIHKPLPSNTPLNIVSSVESAKASWNLGEIASWQSHRGDQLGGQLSALLVRYPLLSRTSGCDS